MPLDRRDNHFVEMAVASGTLDPARARAVLEQRAHAAPAGEPIESFVVRVGLVAPAEVQRIVSYALGHRAPSLPTFPESPALPTFPASPGPATFVPELEAARDSQTFVSELEAARDSQTFVPELEAGRASETYDPALEAARGGQTYDPALHALRVERTEVSLGSASGSIASGNTEIDLGASRHDAAYSVRAGQAAVPSDATYMDANDASFVSPLAAPTPSTAPTSASITLASTPGPSAPPSSSEATYWSRSSETMAPLTASGTQKIGRRLGPFEILDEIARGGMGIVYRARKSGEERVVALKMLLDEANPSEVLRRRFEREIRAGHDIDHPGVVKVYESGVVDGRLYFTMELVDGGSLNDLLPSLGRTTRMAILEQVARAVHAAHEKGYLHRDLKPHNVLVGKDGVPKVADFGLARSLDRYTRLTRTGSVLGTIHYMSPEQATGGGDLLDRGTDVYSLGVMLYQALCGEVPFRDGATHQIIADILTKDPPDPRSIEPTCPPDVAAVALKCLEKSPQKRFPTALALADELRAWLEGERLRTAPPSPVARAVRWLGHHRALAASVGGIALIASASLGLAQVLRDRRARAEVEEEARELAATSAAADSALGRLADPSTALATVRTELEQVETALEHARGLRAAPANAAARAALEERRPAIEGGLFVARAEEVRDGVADLETRLARAFDRAETRLEVRVAYAAALDLAGKLEEERLVLRPVAATSPALSERLGACLLELDAPAEAAAAFRCALELEPARTASRVGLARALVRDGRAVEALETLGPDAGRKRERDERLAFAEAVAATDPGGALADLRRLERANLADAEIARRTAELACVPGRSTEARASFERAQALAPRDARCVAGLAEALLLDGEVQAAKDALERAARLARPGSVLRARIRARQVRVASIGGDDAAADQLARLGLAEKPGDLELRLARALATAGRSDEAAAELADLAAALGARRRALVAWAARLRLPGPPPPPATLPRVRGDDDELLAAGAGTDSAARDLALTAFVSSGSSDGARCYRGAVIAGRLATRFGHPTDKARGETLLRLAERAAPLSPVPVIERSRRRLAGQEVPTAVLPALEPAVSGMGEDPDALELLALALLDQDRRGNAARTLDLARRALARRPSPLGHFLAARALAELRRPKEALASIEASLALDGSDPAVWRLAEAVHEALGDRVSAARAHAEAEDRTEPRRGQIVAQLLENSAENGWKRALELEPHHALANYRALGAALYELANGAPSAAHDPWPHLGTALLSDLGVLNNRGTGLDSARNVGVNELAVRYEDGAEVSDLRTACALRAVALLEAIIDRRSTSEPLIPARLDGERLISREPWEPSLICLQGFLFALERRPELAIPLLENGATYFPNAAVLNYGLAVAEATRGDRDRARNLVRLVGEHDLDLVERLKETAEIRSLDR